MSNIIMEKKTKADPQCFHSLIEVFMYIDGQLDEERAEKIDKHLEMCKECFDRAEFERFLRGHIRRRKPIDTPSASIVDSITELLYSK